MCGFIMDLFDERIFAVLQKSKNKNHLTPISEQALAPGRVKKGGCFRLVTVGKAACCCVEPVGNRQPHVIVCTVLELVIAVVKKCYDLSMSGRST